MAWTKTKTAIVAVVALAAVPLGIQWRENQELRRRVGELQAALQQRPVERAASNSPLTASNEARSPQTTVATANPPAQPIRTVQEIMKQALALPFVDGDGLWQQKGVIRFWSASDGSLRQVYAAGTSIGVTSPVAWSSDATRFAYGTYEGTAVVARTPTAIQTSLVLNSMEILPHGNVLLRQSGTPGAEYHVEATTNMVLWRDLGVSRASANGYFEFLDTNGYGSSLKFYRFRKY